MNQKSRQHEGRLGAAVDRNRVEENDDQTPMVRFEKLTRRLLSVSNSKLKEELEREKSLKGDTRKR
jgi:hypothetical protein